MTMSPAETDALTMGLSLLIALPLTGLLMYFMIRMNPAERAAYDRTMQEAAKSAYAQYIETSEAPYRKQIAEQAIDDVKEKRLRVRRAFMHCMPLAMQEAGDRHLHGRGDENRDPGREGSLRVHHSVSGDRHHQGSGMRKLRRQRFLSIRSTRGLIRPTGAYLDLSPASTRHCWILFRYSTHRKYHVRCAHCQRLMGKHRASGIAQVCW